MNSATPKAKSRAKREIWQPSEYDIKDIRAVQALAIYAQQPDEMKSKQLAPAPSDVKRALDWIVNKAAQTYESTFVPNDPSGRIAAFIDGRRSVGMQIIKLISLKPEPFEEK